MDSLLKRIDAVIPSPLPERCCKMWGSSETLLLFAFSCGAPPDETYPYAIRPFPIRAFKYNIASRTLSLWNPRPGREPEGYVMPVRYFDTNGAQLSHDEAYLKPRLTLSPDRKYLIWRDVREDWLVVNLKDDTSRVQSQCDSESRGGQAVWFANSESWCELGTSGSGKTYTSAEIYSAQDGWIESHAVQGRVRRGVSIGTTPQNDLIELCSRRDSERRANADAEIQRIALEPNITRNASYIFALPSGYRKAEVKLSPDGESLVWILGAEHQSSLWRSGVDGQDFTPLGTLDADALSALAPNEANSMYHLYDLEFLPDRKGISFMCGNNICAMTLPDRV